MAKLYGIVRERTKRIILDRPGVSACSIKPAYGAVARMFFSRRPPMASRMRTGTALATCFTACPGQYMYNRMGELTDLIGDYQG